MSDKFVMPKGRMTVRKSGGRATRLWEFADSTVPTIKKLEAAYLAGLHAMDRTEAKHATNKTDPRLTPDGVRDDLLKFVLADAVPALHTGRQTIAKARSEVAERKSKLKVKGPDPSDVAGAFRRMEIRTLLRDMKPDAQVDYFRRQGDNLPAEIAEAILELPPELAGVSQRRHDMLTERALEAQFGGLLSEIRDIEEAIAAAESSIEAARDEIRIEIGIHDEGKFNAMAAPIEAKQTLPWLRKRIANDVEEVRVVDLERGIERQASPSEIAEGIFAQTFDEFTSKVAA
jgi:hypothetical protein